MSLQEQEAQLRHLNATIVAWRDDHHQSQLVLETLALLRSMRDKAMILYNVDGGQVWFPNE